MVGRRGRLGIPAYPQRQLFDSLVTAAAALTALPIDSDVWDGGSGAPPRMAGCLQLMDDMCGTPPPPGNSIPPLSLRARAYVSRDLFPAIS